MKRRPRVGAQLQTAHEHYLKTVLPGDSSAIPAGERAEEFYAPNFQASFTEVIEQIVPALSNRQIAYMNPSTDNANDADYVWHSNGIDGLEPTFKAIDLSAADSQTQAAFYAGIAFGVAGSTVIALVQEIPEKRKRKSSASGDQKPATGLLACHSQTQQGCCAAEVACGEHLAVRAPGEGGEVTPPWAIPSPRCRAVAVAPWANWPEIAPFPGARDRKKASARARVFRSVTNS